MAHPNFFMQNGQWMYDAHVVAFIIGGENANIPAAIRLIEETPDRATRTDPIGLAPIHYAAAYNHLDLMTYLLDHRGVSINQPASE